MRIIKAGNEISTNQFIYASWPFPIRRHPYFFHHDIQSISLSLKSGVVIGQNLIFPPLFYEVVRTSLFFTSNKILKRYQHGLLNMHGNTCCLKSIENYRRSNEILLASLDVILRYPGLAPLTILSLIQLCLCISLNPRVHGLLSQLMDAR